MTGVKSLSYLDFFHLFSIFCVGFLKKTTTHLDPKVHLKITQPAILNPEQTRHIQDQADPLRPNLCRFLWFVLNCSWEVEGKATVPGIGGIIEASLGDGIGVLMGFGFVRFLLGLRDGYVIYTVFFFLEGICKLKEKLDN